MIILYHKNFLKDLSALPLPERTKIEKLAFVDAPKFRSFREFSKAEKLHGYKNYFKIRFGHYRVGVQFVNNTVTFERVLHRKEIYRYFP